MFCVVALCSSTADAMVFWWSLIRGRVGSVVVYALARRWSHGASGTRAAPQPASAVPALSGVPVADDQTRS